MSFFNLKLFRKSDDILILSIPLYSRLIIFLFSATVTATFFLDPGFSPFPVIILCILLLSAFYKECWVFDRSAEKITYRFGLLFLYRKRVISFHKIEEFHIEGFVKGSMTKKPDDLRETKKKFLETEFYKFSLRDSEWGELIINTVKGREKDKLYLWAEEISTLCNSRLEK
jgi:hypothetical protein